ncbi:MAG: mycothiol biosynthesis protein [Microbacteriaceae bacterium]|nr:mycothiol biosynthesis protein [Microbacteriaceae bacterium]
MHDSLERVLFVHAHPDDESITTGGTIAKLVDEGAQVTVLTCTRGESGEVIPADLQHLLDDQEALAAHRSTELAEAMRLLGVTDHRWLGAADARMIDRAPRRYRDSGMVWGEAGPEPIAELPADALCAAEPGEIAADIATVIATTGATAVVSYDAYGGYGHPDHIAAHDAARHAAEVMGVPYYAIDPTGRDAAANRVVDVTDVLDRKTAALHAHRSQLTVDGDRMFMPGGQIEPIRTVESFRRLDRHRTLPRPWAEQPWRIRILGVAAALLGGAAVGALATVAHQTRSSIAGIDVPVGLIVGLLIVAALLAGLRILCDTRHLSGFAALGILGTIAALSLESAGGSVLIPDTVPAYYWIYGPVIIAAVVLAWPKFGQLERDKIDRTPQPKGTPAP